MFTDMTKMFDPQAASQMMQSFWNQQQWSQNADTYKQLSSLWTQTFTTCYQQQMEMAREAMETSTACFKDLSSAQGMEELMSKQASWTKKATETAQSNAEKLSQTLQKSQIKATELMGKVVASNMESASSCCSSTSSSSGSKTASSSSSK